MTIDTSTLSGLSKLMLVASDMAYAGNKASGDLAPFRDTPSNEYPLPYDISGNGFVVLDKREISQTGFKFVAFRKGNELIVAMGGTDGPNWQDWAGNLRLGWDQWNGALDTATNTIVEGTSGRDIVIATIEGFLANLEVEQRETAKIHFTGQSLGGALAEYAAYDWVRRFNRSPSNITLTTFNGLSSTEGLVKYGQQNVDLVKGFGGLASVAHYFVTNDIVSRLGGGHLGGPGNTYEFRFRSDRINPRTNQPFLLDPVDAHRIEPGFYKQFGRSNDPENVFNDAISKEVELIAGGRAQELAGHFVALFNAKGTTELSARYRAQAGFIAAIDKLENSEDLENLLDPIITALYQSNVIDGAIATHLRVRGVSALKSAAEHLRYMAVKQMLTAMVLEKVTSHTLPQQTDIDSLRVLLGAENIPSNLEAAFFMGAPDRAIDIAAGLEFIDPKSSRWGTHDRQMLEQLGIDPQAVTQALFANRPVTPNSNSIASYLFDYAKQHHHAALSMAWLWAKANFDVTRTFEKKYRTELQREGADMLAYDGALDRVKDSLTANTFGMVRAVGNAYSDFVAKYQNPLFEWGEQLTYSSGREILAGLDFAMGLTRSPAAASELAPELEQLFMQARSEAQVAAQTVVVGRGRTVNPFNDPSFDPDASPLASGQLKEGSVQVFTAYLPYEAGFGGQRIAFTLEGAAANNLSVGDEIVIGADGTFTLTVAEGQRELTFHLAALEDVDADETFTLSAQLVALVDGSDVATHLEHEELELTLDAEDEMAPAGGMELHGDWGIKLYPAFHSDGTPVLDQNGNQVYEGRTDPRYPHRVNLERDLNGRPDFGEQLGYLTGLDGDDHIWLGEFGGAGGAVGGGGNDYFEGMANVPNLIVGDYQSNFLGLSGDDTIEGGENLEPYSDPGFTREGEHIEGIGDDILFGGLGDDDIYADRIALLEETLDPITPALDQKGDWITGEQGDDRIFGSAAHDALFGGGGADEIHGGAGDDVLDGDDNYYNWGDAWWEVDSGAFGVTFFPVTNARSQTFEYYKDFGADDVLDGGAGDDLIFGMLGDDTLIGGSGRDRLEGWEGADQLFGGAGDDVLTGDFGRLEVPWLRLAGANLYVMPGGVGLFAGDGSVVDQVGNDFLDGGAGDDQLVGEAGDDTLLGGSGADLLVGDAAYLPEDLHGNDLLDGGAGADTLSGNAGDDRLFGGLDNDLIRGDAGADEADGGPGDDTIAGGEGDDVLEGSEGADRLAGDAGADVLAGGGGNDDLAGGEGDDVLRGEAGIDSLDGGAGADLVYGGSGDDVLSGGDGNDLIDGGAGIDVLRGGAGIDTYTFGLGYGEDLIEDNEGSNRLQFTAGIAAEDLAALLESATLTATVVFGGAGDSVTLNLSDFQFGGLAFADGTTWGRKDFLGFMPALVSAGSDEDDILVGNDSVRNELRGSGGDDIVTGSANDDFLEGGAGADSLDGAGGSDVSVFTAADSGVDSLSDSELQARAYLDWYYGNLGIADWAERAQHAGKYKAALAWNEGTFAWYYDSFEQAFAELPFAEISLVEPLPSIAPLVRRDDQTALDALVTAGVLSRDVAEFGPGLDLSDLALSITVKSVEAAEHPEQPWYSGGALSVRWGEGGFDLDVPSVNYDFVGSNLLNDGSDPESDAPGAWRGYRLGEGVEAFRLADGTTYTLEEILQQAEVVEIATNYTFSRDSGAQLISRGYPNIVFDPSIRSHEVAVSRDGTDLMLTLVDGSAQGRVAGWYADPASLPELNLQFAFDPQIDGATLTELGLRVGGTAADDVIAGLDGFDDVLTGGARNDILDGGTGRDTYVFNLGDGVDIVADAPSVEADASVIVFGPEIFPWNLQIGLGSLVLEYGEGDAIHFSAFDADDPYSTPVFERLEFDDGSSMSYQEVLEIGFTFSGTEGDDVIVGTGANDFIDGGAGNDTLYGGDGEDNLEGSDGDDTLAGGPGDEDAVSGSGGSDTYLYAPGDGYDQVFESSENAGDVDTLRLVDGILPADVRVTRDHWSYYLLFEAFDRLVIDNMANEPAAVVERIEFGNGTVWTPDDLAARVEFLPGTDLDDVLWGTAANDRLEGLGGDDSLFGNTGNDLLVGGEGSDFYFFRTGGGADVVDNYDVDGSFDWIYFSDASSTDATLARSGDDLAIRIGDGTDRVTLRGWYGDTNRKIDDVFFVGDFVSWDAAVLEGLAPIGGNSAPEVLNAIADQAATEDSAFIFTVPDDAFSDADVDDVLAYAANLPDGSALPAWLSFDPESRIFFGTPTNADVGNFDVTVTATDTSGGSASDTFRIEVVNTNDAPVTEDDYADIDEDGEAVQGNVLSNDSDVDVDDRLAASVPGIFAGAYGELSLASDGTYTYVLVNEAVQPLRGAEKAQDLFVYAASDGISESPGFLTITVTGSNDAPVAHDDAVTIEEDGPPVTGDVLANDIDGDANTVLTVMNPGIKGGQYGTLNLLPDGTYAYALEYAAVQSLAAGQSVIDTFGYVVVDDDATPLTGSGRLVVTIAGVNDAPVVVGALAAQFGGEGEALDFRVPSGVFADVDNGDQLALTATRADGAALPGWLSFENSGFTGTPGLTDGGEYRIQVIATDIAGASAAAGFSLTVSDSLAVGDRLIGTRGDDVLNGTDADEMLDGRAGTDRLLAGGGDDVLRFFADDRVKGKNRSTDIFDGDGGFDTLLGTEEHDALYLDDGHSGPRILGIEYVATGEGHDLVDLWSGRFAYGDVIIDGGDGNDALRASIGNDVLIGGKGNDELSGGPGRDLYIHGRHGGNDEIDEAGIASELDILRFGDGITPGMVRARHHHGDLVLDVAGPHGSVTVKGWFASAAQRVELIEFADGSAWDERIVRKLIDRSHDDGWREDTHRIIVRDDGRPQQAPSASVDRRADAGQARDEVAATIAGRLAQNFFDFDALVRALDSSTRRDEALMPAEIARQWAAVQRHASALAIDADDAGHFFALSGWQRLSQAALSAAAASGFGFEASIGMARGANGLNSLEGLSEGFRRL